MPGARRDPERTSALYVRIPEAEAEKLDLAAFELRAHKRDLVAGLLARYVDPLDPVSLQELRALSGAGAEIPPRPEREPDEPAPRRVTTLGISRASNWVAGVQTEIRDFANARGCETPVVRLTLDDGEELFLSALRAGPGDDYVDLSAYPLEAGMPRRLIVRLDAVRKLEFLPTGPSEEARGFVFHPRGATVGFGQRE